ncbi:MAG TPA: aspartate:alanine exchanger family transporter [Acidimicrobiia bacterium]|nr:aspartate:alanine exchanger family transporter [Acidimicrobiia bacterium]
MTELLLQNPLLLLFLVLGVGYLVGRVNVGGFSLGISAVLFVGLAFGALDPGMRLPDFVYLFGLVLFVYTVGLSAGPGFIASFQRGGARYNALVVVVLVTAFAVTLGGARLLGMEGSFAAGVYTGSLTSTPALAAVLQHQTATSSPEDLDRSLAEPVIGYSVSYPFGVLGMVLAVSLLGRMRRDRGKPEEIEGVHAEDLVRTSIVVTAGPHVGVDLATLIRETGWRVLFTRHREGEGTEIPHPESVFHEGDVITVIGESGDVARVVGALGVEAAADLALDRTNIDYRRIFVSDDSLVGRRIADLDLLNRFGAIITRVRRGDVDRMARPDTVLELGDRIRVVAPRERMAAVSEYFGDSYRKLSEIDVASFSLGIVLGLLLGMIPFPLPGGTTFTLGPAGGPLLVGLLFGALGQTGPFTWQLPYNASLTLRQLGAVLFLAGVGTRSGYVFVDTIGDGAGFDLLLLGAVVTALSATLVILGGRYVLRSPSSVLAGTLGGLVTQPAVLAFAVQQTGDELPNTGYATVYPVATIAKILLAQTIVVLLS